MMRVVVAPGVLVAGTTVTLAPTEAHHLMVRRVVESTEVVALDTNGHRAKGHVTRVGKDWRLQVESVELAAPPRTTILVVGAGDRERFGQLVEKCTELGVSRIIPIETEHSQQVASRLRSTGIEKVRRIAAEACKQSDNAWAPVIDEVSRFEDFLVRAPQARWLLASPGGQPCPPVPAEQAVGWLIGPEGGFSDLERATLHRVLSAESVGLGPHVLRFESAAIAAAAVTADRRLHV